MNENSSIQIVLSLLYRFLPIGERIQIEERVRKYQKANQCYRQQQQKKERGNVLKKVQSSTHQQGNKKNGNESGSCADIHCLGMGRKEGRKE